MSLAIRIETVELPGGGTALRATCRSTETSRGAVVAIIDQAEHGSTDSVPILLQALGKKLARHGFTPKELL